MKLNYLLMAAIAVLLIILLNKKPKKKSIYMRTLKRLPQPNDLLFACLINADKQKEEEFIQKLQHYVNLLNNEFKAGASIEYFLYVIGKETAFTFSPRIKNPNSSATGLIQFMDATAKGLGTTTAELREMTQVQQLEYVYKYFKDVLRWIKYKKLNSPAKTYAAVFYPKMLEMKPEEKLPLWVVRANPFFDFNKNGEITKQEFFDGVQRDFDRWKRLQPNFKFTKK